MLEPVDNGPSDKFLLTSTHLWGIPLKTKILNFRLNLVKSLTRVSLKTYNHFLQFAA